MRSFVFVVIVICFFPGCKKQEKTAEFDYAAIEKHLVPAVYTGEAPVTHTMQERMAHYSVPGVSFAIFKDGRIVRAKGYGVTKAGSGKEVTAETMFQAASISKPVTALGVLRLIERYHLDLDAPVNRYLKSWKIKSPLLEKSRVTLRRLLSHTAGTTVGAIPGFEKTDTLPTTAGVLSGKGKTPPVTLDTIPGARFFYSGGGYMILQQLIEDVSGKSFEDYFEQEIFSPLRMSHSTFHQFPKNNVSVAHGWEGKPYPTGWRVFAGMAAAGLWTTPSDLAKFCIAIEDAYFGKKGAIISRELAREMLGPLQGYGLGVRLRKVGEDRVFQHGGSNPGGYRNFMLDAYTQRTGIIVMTNGTQGGMLHDDLIRSFSAFFNIKIKAPKHIDTLQLKNGELEKFTGRYQFREMGAYYLEVTADSNHQLILYDPNDGMRKTYVPVSNLEFIERDDGSALIFETDSLTGEIKRANFSETYIFYKVD